MYVCLNSHMNEQLDFALSFARDAGKIIKDNFQLGMVKTWKEDDTPVTVTDETINRNLIEAVKAKFPTYAVLGEEESYTPENPEMTWVCDPVDGTWPFSSGIPLATFSLGLVGPEGAPVLGVVYDPFTDRLLSAVKGEGAYMGEQKLSVSKKDSLKSALLDLDVWPQRIQLANRSLREDLLDLGAIPISLCAVIYASYLVALGEVDGVVFNVEKPEDIAAAKVIIEEAGGKVTDLDGNEQSYLKATNGAVLSNGLIHDKLIELLHS